MGVETLEMVEMKTLEIGGGKDANMQVTIVTSLMVQIYGLH